MFLLEKGSWLLSLYPEGGSYHPVLVASREALGRALPGPSVGSSPHVSLPVPSLFECSGALPLNRLGSSPLAEGVVSPSLIPWALPGTWITRQRQAEPWPPHQWCLATKMQLCLSFPSVPFGVFWPLQGDWAGNSSPWLVPGGEAALLPLAPLRGAFGDGSSKGRLFPACCHQPPPAAAAPRSLSQLKAISVAGGYFRASKSVFRGGMILLGWQETEQLLRRLPGPCPALSLNPSLLLFQLATVQPGMKFHMYTKEELEEVIKDI